MFFQSAAGLCKHFPIVGDDVSPKDITDWNVKCFPDRLGVCCVNLGVAFNVEESTCCTIVKEKDASVLLMFPDVACSD